MSKMGLHDPFRHFKHKLWPKEGSGVKLVVWFPIIKNKKLPWFPCVQVVCDILLEILWQGLQLCFTRHLHQRSTHEVMGPQSHENPNFGNFWTLTWESQDKCHLGVSHVARHKVFYKGKVVASLKFGPWWVLWIHVCVWFVLTPKTSNLRTKQLVVLFVQVRVSDWCLSFVLVPILKLQHSPLPLKCYKLRRVPQLFIFSLFSS
jgi:hypothetical protein